MTRDILTVPHLQTNSQRPDLVHPKPLPILPVQDLIPPTRLLRAPSRVIPPGKRHRVILGPRLRVRKSHELGHPNITEMGDIHVSREDGAVDSVVYDFRRDGLELVSSAEHSQLSGFELCTSESERGGRTFFASVGDVV